MAIQKARQSSALHFATDMEMLQAIDQEVSCNRTEIRGFIFRTVSFPTVSLSLMEEQEEAHSHGVFLRTIVFRPPMTPVIPRLEGMSISLIA